MAVKVEIIDNTLKVIDALDGAIEAALLEAAAEIEAAVKRNTRVDTGQTKNSWQSDVHQTSDGFEAVVGSPLENAVWEEFGTGEYAVNGNGRKGGWTYVDAKGQGHFTRGKKPSRAFQNAIDDNKDKIINHLKEKLG